jgi:hypothetical protein
MRVRALRQLESDLGVKPFDILNLALTRSDREFSPDLKAVHRIGTDIPQVLLRIHSTPLCPECLKEGMYIRQRWELTPYQVCHLHQCTLLFRCPECGRSCDYKHSESITHCECGFDFRTASSDPADDNALLLARWVLGESVLNDAFDILNSSQRLGFYLWFARRYGDADINLDTFVDYLSNWPNSVLNEMKHIAEKSDLVRINPWTKSSFQEVFGSLLKECRRLPDTEFENNIVLSALFSALVSIVGDASNKAKHGDIGDILLSSLETSALLSCSTDKVYQLYELGEIKLATRVPLHTKLPVHQPAFTLRSVIETRLASNHHVGQQAISQRASL